MAILWPYLFARKKHVVSGAFDSAIYRDQLEELDADVSRGLIGTKEAEAAKLEISRRLLNVSEISDGKKNSDNTGHTTVKNSALMAMIAAVCVPFLSLALYFTYGSPELPDQPLAPRLANLESTRQIDVLIKKVEARLQSHPGDGQGWDVIAPVYFKQHRYNDAANAYANALRLLGESSDRLTGHGEALVMASNGIVTEPARKSFQRALVNENFLPKAQFWLGMAEEQDGDFGEASRIWRKMLAKGAANAPWRGPVEQRLELARKRLGSEGGERALAAKPEEEQPLQRGPSKKDIAAAQQMNAQERNAMINQMVERLALRLQEKGDDLQGWLRLVRAYSVLGKRNEAGEALKAARENFGQNEKALTALAGLAKDLGL